MRVLVRIIILVLVLLSLEGIKRLIMRTQDAADLFYYNLLSCLQLFLLLGSVFILITYPLLKRAIKRRLLLWQSTMYIVLVGVLELFAAYLLDNPKSIPSALLPAAKYYYDHFECRIIQYEPAFTRYDSTLYYSLKSNARFTYRNHEYVNEFVTNSQGFRDDEASLSGPEIICLGDSYTLGWGADESQSFPAILEKRTGLRTLNAAMSSYGTAREGKVFSGLDTSRLKYIIWQYCFNDEEENETFLRNGRVLSKHPPQSLDSVMDLHSWTRGYFPGRHVFTMGKLLMNRSVMRSSGPTGGPTRNEVGQKKQASLFMDVVSGSGIDFSKIKVIVLDLGPYPLQDHFIDEVRSVAAARGLSDSFLFLDCKAILAKDDFYTLDVHLTPEGNRKVAEALAGVIRK